MEIKITPTHSMFVFIKYRIIRLLNSIMAITLFGKKKLGRQPTRPKKIFGGILALFFAAYMLFVFTVQTNDKLMTLFSVTGHVEVVKGVETYPAWSCLKTFYVVDQELDWCKEVPPAQNSLVPKMTKDLLVVILSMIVLTVFFNATMGKELAAPEWDLEWLYTLPMPFSTLIFTRIIERTIVNPAAIYFLLIFLTVLGFHLNFGYLSFVVGIVGMLLLSFLISIFRTVLDTGLRMVWQPSRLKNIQAAITVVSMFFLIALISPMLSNQSILFRIARTFEFSLIWNPASLTINALTAATFSNAMPYLFGLIFEIAIVYALSYQFLKSVLKKGVTVSGARSAQKRGAIAIPFKFEFWLRLFSPLQLKELKLLIRDKNMALQTVFMPLIIVGVQLLVVGEGHWKTWFTAKYSILAATAFGIGTYSLVFSALTIFNTEGGALWMLYTVPEKIENLIKQKLYLWLSVALFYPLVIFAINFGLTREIDLSSLGFIILTLLGVAIMSVVAVCFSLFGFSVPADDAATAKPNLTLSYLFMIIAAFYGTAIAIDDLWLKIVLLILITAMSLSLVQKARDHIPFLLDKAAMPPPTVSLSDGLIATLAFLMLQNITMFLLVIGRKVQARHISISYAAAGIIVVGVLSLVYWRKKTSNVPLIFSSKPWAQQFKSVSLGFILGCVSGMLGIGYLWLCRSNGAFADELQTNIHLGERSPLWIAFLVLIAAPLVEEFLFRGIIFSGLKRSWSTLASALLSAAIFASIHPPVSVMPVFVVGLATAYVYERTQILAAPMMTHITYNFFVLVVVRFYNF